MDNLLTEFRRELLMATNKLDAEGFYTKSEIEKTINNAYGRAKQKCLPDDPVSTADNTGQLRGD